jgi:caffeoyl-CoA O-methyltransferase
MFHSWRHKVLLLPDIIDGFPNHLTNMIPLIDTRLEEYAIAHSDAPSPLLQELQAYTYEHCDNPQMVTGPLEAGFLRILVQLIGARRVLEIGLFTGYSALAMAEALPTGGELISCEIDPAHCAIANSFFDRSPHGDKIRVELGPALETLDTITGWFDMVFLDADKENYVQYYEKTLSLLRPEGLLVADNTLWSGRVLDPKKETDHALVEFNQHVQQDDRVENVLLTVRDGMMLVRKHAQS